MTRQGGSKQKCGWEETGVPEKKRGYRLRRPLTKMMETLTTWFTMAAAGKRIEAVEEQNWNWSYA
jgi:hypothetical protein